MAGRSPVVADEQQKRALAELGRSQDRGEADRARAILPTLSGWTSPDIATPFGVREDTARLWRGAFLRGGVAALRTRPPPGPAPRKAEGALAVAEVLLAAPVADRPNWTLPRLAAEIEERAGLRISRSHLSVVLRRRGISDAGGPATRRRGGGTPTRWTAQGCAASS
jgi:transposase